MVSWVVFYYHLNSDWKETPLLHASMSWLLNLSFIFFIFRDLPNALYDFPISFKREFIPFATFKLFINTYFIHFRIRVYIFLYVCIKHQFVLS